MKRVRIRKPIRPRRRWWLDVLPLDPRDQGLVDREKNGYGRRRLHVTAPAPEGEEASVMRVIRGKGFR